MIFCPLSLVFFYFFLIILTETGGSGNRILGWWALSGEEGGLVLTVDTVAFPI
jgi:hypothetical protein